MNTLQKEAKECLETCFKDLTGENLIVEYVPDVSLRAEVILKEIGVEMNDAYQAEHYTGTFMPATEKSPFFILIQEDRKDYLYVMTAFHEFQHALDYVVFLSTVFNNDKKAMVHSDLYRSFQIYSEFSATRFGVSCYYKKVSFDNMSNEQFASLIIENAKNDFSSNSMRDKYEEAMCIVRFLGVLYGLKENIEFSELDDEIKKVIEEYGFQNIITLLNNVSIEKEFFELFDRRIKEYIYLG